ncbi:hypothetical protein [Streptomyces sp. NPDC048606]|uniref:hypothetical protein n=1 Tax=Streptomyces sp. NPDC048606 TaxID=3154726 RepID=UPI003429B2CA
MTESEKFSKARAVREGTSTAAETTSGPVGVLAALPAPFAEKTAAATEAVRGSVGKTGWVWSAIGARKAVTAGAVTVTAAVVTTAYALGRRAGLRRRGPLSRLTGGRV